MDEELDKESDSFLNQVSLDYLINTKQYKNPINKKINKKDKKFNKRIIKRRNRRNISNT